MPADELMQKFLGHRARADRAHHAATVDSARKGTPLPAHSGTSDAACASRRPERRAPSSLRRPPLHRLCGIQHVEDANVTQVLETMKHLENVGAPQVLDIDETIPVPRARRLDRAGVRRELRDRISVVLLIDNGGSSMLPYVDLTTAPVRQLHDRFHDHTYYFHNTIYDRYGPDIRARNPWSLNGPACVNPRHAS